MGIDFLHLGLWCNWEHGRKTGRGPIPLSSIKDKVMSVKL
jgi:hypothetical protein